MPSRISTLVALTLLAVAPRPGAVLAQGKDHCGAVSNNETWAASASPHNVTCDVTVRNSVLRLEAGALVLMHPGTNLILERGSSLQAVGNQRGKIRIRAIPDDVEPGYWGQIRFMADADASAMEFVEVSDGGQGGQPMVLVLGSVVRMGSQPTPSDQFKNVRLMNSAGVPLAITANEVGPSLAAAGDFSLGRACGQLSIEESNTLRAIEILAAGEPDVTDSQTWFDFCVPYQTMDKITVAGPDAPTLEISSGVEIRFGPDGGIVAGLDADNPGQLETNGTPDQAVRLTGLTQEPGSWGGVDLTEFTSGGHSLSETSVEYGGLGGRPMVRVTTADAIAGIVAFRHAASYPLEIVADGVQGFLEGLWIAGVEGFEDNGIQRVRVIADGDEPALSRSTTWGALGVPFEIDGTLTVASPGLAARFRLLPGATLAFAPGQTLTIGDPEAGSGSLQIEGDANRRAVLTGVEATPGSWGGLVITDAAEEATIRGARIEFGGSAPEAMVRWGDVDGTVTTTVLAGAPGYPLSVPLGRIGVLVARHVASPGDRNIVQDNGVDRFLVSGADIPQSGRFEWYDPGAAIEFDGSLAFTGSSARLDLHDGLRLRFRAGQGMRIGGEATQRVTLHFDDDDADDRVALGAADSAAGWGGLTIARGSEATGGGVTISNAAADSANLVVAGGEVDLRDVDLADAAGIGLDAVGGRAQARLVRSRITGNRIGVRARDDAFVEIAESTVTGNTEVGVVNEHQSFCIDAVRVFWGRQRGPDDASAAPDHCMTAANLSPGADKVSDFVDWWPYALDVEDYRPAPGLGPNPKKLFVPLVARNWRRGH